jgi:5-methylcytosine-specific restriction protein A
MPWSARRVQRRALPREQRLRVLARDSHRCQLRYPGCLVHAVEVDHVVPVAEGGTDCDSNLRAACTECHRVKSQAEALRGRLRAYRAKRLGMAGHPGLR